MKPANEFSNRNAPSRLMDVVPNFSGASFLGQRTSLAGPSKWAMYLSKVDTVWECICMLRNDLFCADL